MAMNTDKRLYEKNTFIYFVPYESWGRRGVDPQIMYIKKEIYAKWKEAIERIDITWKEKERKKRWCAKKTLSLIGIWSLLCKNVEKSYIEDTLVLKRNLWKCNIRWEEKARNRRTWSNNEKLVQKRIYIKK